jgi:hypothetical protein
MAAPSDCNSAESTALLANMKRKADNNQMYGIDQFQSSISSIGPV